MFKDANIARFPRSVVTINNRQPVFRELKFLVGCECVDSSWVFDPQYAYRLTDCALRRQMRDGHGFVRQGWIEAKLEKFVNITCAETSVLDKTTQRISLPSSARGGPYQQIGERHLLSQCFIASGLTLKHHRQLPSCRTSSPAGRTVAHGRWKP